MPLLCFHLVPQSLVLFRFAFRQRMLLKTQTDQLTGRDSDIIQIWKGHDHFARGHIRRIPAGFIIFNVQLAKKKKKEERKHQNKTEAQLWLWFCPVGREFSAYYRGLLAQIQLNSCFIQRLRWSQLLDINPEGKSQFSFPENTQFCLLQKKVQNWE